MNYVLKGKTPVPEPNLVKWARAFESNRTVRFTRLRTLSTKIDISTVFLGIDHNFFDNGPPILFETMIFGGRLDEYQERRSTWEEAEKMHEQAIAKVAEEYPGIMIIEDKGEGQ